MVQNKDIKTKAKEKNIRLWEIADKLGVADTTMSRWLRKELPKDKKLLIFKAIDEIATEKKTITAE